MSTEGNGSSVLARLMGIDRPPPQMTNGRQRVLSDSYLQKISSLSSWKKFVKEENADVFSMVVADNKDCANTVDFVDGTCVDYHHSVLCGDVDTGMTTSAGDSSMEHTFEQDEGFEIAGCTNRCFPVRNCTVQGPSYVLVAEKQFSSETNLCPSNSEHNNSGRYTQKYFRNGIEVKSDYNLSSERVMKQNMLDEISYRNKKTMSSPTILPGRTGKELKTGSLVENEGASLQERRKKSLLNNGIRTTLGGYGTPKEIAKQLTSQVKHSVWHSCTEALRSKNQSEGSDANKCEKTTSSTAFLSDLVNKPAVSSFDPSKRPDSRTTHKEQEKHLESRKARRFSLEERMIRRSKTSICTHKFCFLKNEDTDICIPVKSKMNSWLLGSARFLSKPTLFPSAWVPCSKERRFTLDANWCLRPGESNGNLCNASVEEGVGYDTLTFGPHALSLDMDKLHLDDQKSSITNGSLEYETQSIVDEILTTREYFSDQSGFSDIGSPIYHEACESLIKKWNDHEKDDCQDSPGSLMKTCDLSSVGGKTEEVTGKVSQNLPSKYSESSLFDYVATPVKDFVLKHELKRISPPGSPVSSLEGPEPCRRCHDFAVESKEFLTVPQCPEKDTLGLRTKLHLIEVMSLESSSEGREMVVSSDEGSEGGLIGCYHEDAQITECTSENCEFSYLVDVLVESGILMGNLDNYDGILLSRGYMLDSSVFDLLEKKYGKSTVIERSERRLLFDRIKSGLVEIFQTSVGGNSWRKPVVKRISVRQTQDFIEEELWALLVKQEEQTDNVCREQSIWLDLDEDVDLIVQEMQSLLIDGLIEEFVEV